MTTATEQRRATERQATSGIRPARANIAIVLSIVALVTSGFSLAAWQTSNVQRQQIEDRLACLELPGPNDCGLDGE